MFDKNLQDYHTVEFKILMEFLKDVANLSPKTDQKFKEFLGNAKIRPSELAARLSIPPQTINSALTRMQEKGQIKWKKYKAVELDIVKDDSIIHLQNHLHLVQDFLTQSLDLTQEEAFEESLKLAPNISCNLAERICTKYHLNQCSGLVVLYPECHDHCDDSLGGDK
jgi:Mn-dependent DtxR family transcriptional regulator